jgi:hypothetical protein
MGNLHSLGRLIPCASKRGFQVRMKLQQEVRHKSEDVGDAVLLDVVQAIRRRVKIVSREYDIPYIAGYSSDYRSPPTLKAAI